MANKLYEENSIKKIADSIRNKSKLNLIDDNNSTVDFKGQTFKTVGTDLGYINIKLKAENYIGALYYEGIKATSAQATFNYMDDNNNIIKTVASSTKFELTESEASQITKVNITVASIMTLLLGTRTIDGVVIVSGDELPSQYTEITKYKINEMANAIDDIEIGTIPTGEISITSNGDYDVTEYASAKVEVEGAGVGFTGHVDSIGLKSIGWTDNDIAFFQRYGVKWDEKNDSDYILTTDDKGTDINKKRFAKTTDTSLNSKKRLIGIPLINTSARSSMNAYFSNCNALIAIPLLNTSNVSDFYQMCYECNSLAHIENIDLSKATNCGYMFYNCYSLKDVPNFNLENATATGSMFSNCKGIEKMTNLNLKNSTNISSMFTSCSNLKYVNFENTEKTTTVNGLFYNCHSLKNVDGLNTSNATDFTSLFNNCYSLERVNTLISNKCTSLTTAFYYCYALKEMPLTDFSRVTQMSNCFSSCNSITEFGNINSSLCINFGAAFASCASLKKIQSIDLSSAITITNIFSYDTELTDIGEIIDLGKAYLTTTAANYSNYTLSLSNCTKLTEQSLINVLNGLYDIASKGCNAQRCTLGSTNLKKLTSEEGQQALANARAKGWTVS